MAWAQYLKRVFGIDMETWPGGRPARCELRASRAVVVRIQGPDGRAGPLLRSDR